ncbi:MAG: helix-turn-helix transcriptional regulator [bacterium]|nr:helix-turn-helix transcriptional regulator [bacterium]MDD5354205.1 helix-turn-helix transcriptional regulator [bacterium]MDD5756634.1 helix-turn-helix transcriptional regulator [bacterium]
MDLFIGTTLSEARKQKKVSLKKIAQEIKISSRYLQALEAETYDIFPAEVYLKGFLRSYAQYLGLDGEEMVRAYNRQHGQPTESSIGAANPTPVPLLKINARLLVWSITAIIAVILILILILRLQ